jgi:hypothetical protein
MREETLLRVLERLFYRDARQMAISTIGVFVLVNVLLWVISALGWATKLFWTIGIGLTASFASVGMLLVIWGTVKRNRWGINTGPLICPHCHHTQRLPFEPRKPTSLQQLLWGGETCSVCGTHFDNWGRELRAPDQAKSGATRESNHSA